jgi:hypothetical protein
MAKIEKTLTQKLEENQTISKSTLIVAGTSLLSVGLGLVEKNSLVGIVLIVLGVACLVFREIRKLN